jgi:hypothetical protein
MEICELCKVKLIDFYHFKMKSEEVRKRMQTKVNNESEQQNVESSEQKTVFNTLQIIKNYVSKHSITEIQEDEDEKRLIIIPKSSNFDHQNELNVVDVKEEFMEEPEEIEYIEECMDEEFEEREEEVEIEDEIDVGEAEEEQEEVVIDYEDESEDEANSYDHQNSASESQSESKASSSTRRTRRPELWACNQRKSLRNAGLTYINTKGVLVEGKRMKESCGTSCRSKCITKITEQDRQRFFDEFWGLGDVIKQRKFIYRHITSAVPTRRKVVNSSRSLTLKFYIENEHSQPIQVCKKMFKNTLVISSQVIQGVVKKYAVEGFLENRGRFQRKTTPAQALAIEHVKRFPFFYIEQTMTKVQCYHMYCDECLEKGIDPVKEGYYRDMFDKQNQGSFLKTDRISCEWCHKYYKASDNEQAEMQKEHESHIGLGMNKKCRDRALGRLRNKRASERKRAKRLAGQQSSD